MKRIFGVNIDLYNESIVNCETREDISNLGLFDHLSFEEMENATDELCLELGIKEFLD